MWRVADQDGDGRLSYKAWRIGRREKLKGY